MLVALAVPAFAQQPPPDRESPYTPSAPPAGAPEAPFVRAKKATPEDLADVAAQVKKGAYDAALAALTAFEPTVETIRLRIDSLLGLNRRNDALSEYQSMVQVLENEDPPSLRAIARYDVGTLAASKAPDVRVGALTALIGLGDAPARTTLQTIAADEADSEAGRLANLALARARDKAAIVRVRAIAEAGPPRGRMEAIEVLGETDRDAAVKLLLSALDAPDPFQRIDATDLLARFRVKSAVPRIKEMMQDRQAPFVRLPAAVALRRLGDPGGDAVLAASLTSALPDMRMMAARAYRDSGGDRSWVTAVRPLLANMDGLNRLAAAELLIEDDRPAAVKTLGDATKDPNPAVRAEAARILAKHAPELALLRPLLRDPGEPVRLEAATGILRATDRPSDGNAAPPRD